MIQEIIEHQLDSPLVRTDYNFLGRRYQGKVRDSYSLDGKRYLIATDRLSCFDVILTAVPFKGQVLTQLAEYWFEKTKDIIGNHIIDVPDPNVMVAHECEVLPIEVVVRGYLAGSAWRDYEAGKEISGVKLSAGMKMHQKLDAPILTPATKAEVGEHDEPISKEEIVSRGLLPQEQLDEIERVAMALFERGTQLAAEEGLILVDTKYEFGFLKGELILVDEIHTLDSSRYWEAESYKEHFEAGTPPVMLDKEPVRRWLMDQGYMGEGTPPEFTDEYLQKLSFHYIHSYGRITGLAFTPYPGDTNIRIENNLREYLG